MKAVGGEGGQGVGMVHARGSSGVGGRATAGHAGVSYTLQGGAAGLSMLFKGVVFRPVSNHERITQKIGPAKPFKTSGPETKDRKSVV